jgi:filamentous hemagglutinin
LVRGLSVKPDDSKGSGGDAAAVAFISQNAGSLFTATTTECKSPFLHGNKDDSLTPEQRALPGAVPTPKLGLAVAAALAAPAILPVLAAIPGAPIFGPDGLLSIGTLASQAGAGAISGGVNATSQHLQNGSVNLIDIAYATVAGMAGAYGGFGWNVFINGMAGAANTATNNVVFGKDNSVIFGGAANASAAALGYGAGKVMEGATNAALAPSLNNSGWASTGRWSGPSGITIFTPNNLPAITSGIAGAAGSEGGAAAINNLKSNLEE